MFDKLRNTWKSATRRSSGKIVAISRILDECDIVEAFVRHTALYASAHIFIDNGSRDGTLEVLRNLKKEGFDIKVFQNKSVSFNEINFNTYMFHEAKRSYNADWILCLDVDEFIDDRGIEGGLLQALDQIARTQPTVRGINVPLTEYRRSSSDNVDEIVVPQRIRRRTEVTTNTKIFISGRLSGPNIQVSGGNHFVDVGSERLPCIEMPGLVLAHYADRSPYQVAAKWVKGWAKVLAAGPEFAGANTHYREPFRVLRDEPHLLLRTPGVFLDSHANLELTDDPIAYQGGALMYTVSLDEPMRAMRMMMGYLEDLALRHGKLIQECPEARQIIDKWNVELSAII